jgi:hypothetical protein
VETPQWLSPGLLPESLDQYRTKGSCRARSENLIGSIWDFQLMISDIRTQMNPMNKHRPEGPAQTTESQMGRPQALPISRILDHQPTNDCRCSRIGGERRISS